MRSGSNHEGARPEVDQEPVLTIDGICKRIGGETVLSSVSLRVRAGQFTMLVGPSGSGKTTLIRIIAGLSPADAGRILLGGRDYSGRTPQARRIAVVSGGSSLFEGMSVRENLVFAWKQGGVAEDREALIGRLSRLAGIETKLDKRPTSLSKGEKQRVAVIRAIINRPGAILLDDPFNHLDAAGRLNLRSQLAPVLRSLNIPILFVTGDQEEAFELGDRIGVLLAGRIEQTGTPFDVYTHPTNQAVAAFLGAANLLVGRWDGSHVLIGSLKIEPPESLPPLDPGQLVKVAFRAEDVVVGYQPHFYDAAHHLGNGVIETTYDLGPYQRLIVRLAAAPKSYGERPRLVDGTFGEGLSLTVIRSKWESSETPLEQGSLVAVGLKGYLIMPHYPLMGEP